MTKEEILAMEPGPELDTLVAEKVMNHPMPDFISEDALDLYLAGTPIHCDSWTCVCRYDEGDIPKWVPATYSTDISAAWLAVEKMKDMIDNKGNQLLCCLKIHCDIPGEVWDIHWSYSELSTMNDGHKDHKLPLSWFSLPEAICKAALIIFMGK